MSRLLAQSINVAPLAAAGQRNGRNQHKECEKSPRSVKTMACRTLRAYGLRMSPGFLSSGLLRTVNPLNTNTIIPRPPQDIDSDVPSFIGGARRRTRFVPKAMPEHFTEKSIKAIMLAQEEARRLGHHCVGTEQILLGLLSGGTGIAAKVLKSVGISLEDARLEVERITGRGCGSVPVEIPFTPRAKRVLELALAEARQLGHNYIGSEHLLLGLLREGEGVAARVLKDLDVDPDNIRAQVLEELSQN